jgi:hypothetical protein
MNFIKTIITEILSLRFHERCPPKFSFDSLTKDYYEFHRNSDMSEFNQLAYMAWWAETLEKRVKELDPDYRSYPFGLVKDSKPTDLYVIRDNELILIKG